MSAADATQTHLLDVLDEQIRCAQDMLGALVVEDTALREGDTTRLNEASADKARLVESLENLEQERSGLARALELQLSATEGTGTGVKWRELLGVLEQCRQKNQRNGALVRARREQVLAALKLIRGTESDLYDSKGLERAAPTAQRLGSA
jgi:flagellar biosynthesis/type III secretory pathway chaperone